jgi:hypothetical protein
MFGNLRSVKQRNLGWGLLGLASSLAIFTAGCAEGAGAAEPAAEPGRTSSNQSKQDQVLGCFASAFKTQKGTLPPPADASEREAAGQLLERYNGKLRRICGTIAEALKGDLCEMPVTLASVVACDRHGPHGDVDLNTADKARMDDRVRERERISVDPTTH